MGKTYDHIPTKLIQWIREQEVFWVATAPLAESGHINVSPKGVRGTFHVDGPNKVWYDDMSGSGCETIAHLRENGRITFLFNALEGPPRILRLYGRGKVHEFGTPEYEALLPLSQRKPGSRAAIVVDIDRVSTSCGWGVPFYKFLGHRKLLLDWAYNLEKHDLAFDADANDNAIAPNGIKDVWDQSNTFSIDDLPALDSCLTSTVPLTSVRPDPASSGEQTAAAIAMEIKVSDLGIESRAGTFNLPDILKAPDFLRVIVAFIVGSMFTSFVFVKFPEIARFAQ